MGGGEETGPGCTSSQSGVGESEETASSLLSSEAEPEELSESSWGFRSSGAGPGADFTSSHTGVAFTSGLNSLAVGFSGSLTRKYSPVFEISSTLVLMFFFFLFFLSHEATFFNAIQLSITTKRGHPRRKDFKPPAFSSICRVSSGKNSSSSVNTLSFMSKGPCSSNS